MYIQRIHLQNFRCYVDSEIEFNDRFNLIVGNNGFGKTSILEAIAIGISAYIGEVKALPASSKRNIIPKDVRIRRIAGISEIVEIAEQYPVKLEFEMLHRGMFLPYARIKKNKGANTVFENSRNFMRYASEDMADGFDADQIITEGKKEILPAFAYHGTGRLWSQASAKKDVNNRINGYENCINPISNVKQYTKWIRDIRRYEIDEGVDSEELRALYDAVETFLGKGSKISYKIKDKAILVTLPNGQSLPFDLLSDGYKNAIGIVLDTAYRMIRLNPWLRKEAVKETPGILLIDEIDLHLHPSWQKRIVDDLKRTFPKMQIIATTHAPIVVSSCEANELIVLDAEYSKETEYDIKIKRTKTTKGWMAEDVLSDIMDVESSRDLETEFMIKEYHRLFAEKVQEGQPFEVEGKLKELQDKLISRLPSNDPALTLAKLDILDMME